MTFDYLSDVHLEFFDDINGLSIAEANRYWFRKFAGECADVLLIAGDITSCYQKDRAYVDQFFEIVCDRYKKVYAVLGNHDYWSYTTPLTEMKSHFQRTWSRVCFLEKDSVRLRSGLRLFGATWWTSISPKLADFARDCFNDYKHIRQGEGFVTPAFTSELHAKSREALIAALTAHPNDDFIVLTHHAPSRAALRFHSPIFPAAYVSDDDDVLNTSPQIKVWVHGHLHREVRYGVGYARIYANAHGYLEEERCIDDDGTTDFEISRFSV